MDNDILTEAHEARCAVAEYAGAWPVYDFGDKKTIQPRTIRHCWFLRYTALFVTVPDASAVIPDLRRSVARVPFGRTNHR
nr:hypothetical protein [Oryza sativa Japonica Group]